MSTPFFPNVPGGGQPHRRVLKGRVTSDADGNAVFQPLHGQAHIISDEDSLDTFEPEFDAFLDCGCGVKENQPRYHCCERGCAHVVCERHVNYCHCGKGLCPQCSYTFELTPGQPLALCLDHYHEARRRRMWQRVVKTALRPFVTFDDRETPP